MFENNIFGMVAPDELLDIGYEVTRPNDPVDQIVDDVKTDNLIAYWETMAAEYQIRFKIQIRISGNAAVGIGIQNGTARDRTD